MKKAIVASLLALPLLAQTAAAEAGFVASCKFEPTRTLIVNNIRQAEGPLFIVLASLDENVPVNGSSFFLGLGSLNVLGDGRFDFEVPNLDLLPPNTMVYFRGFYAAGGRIRASEVSALLLRPSPCESLGMDWGPGGLPLVAGEEITDQWASIGVTVSADNRRVGHPDKAIVFDSANPTGNDMDLMTPGIGTDNLVARGNLLIIAEDDVDANNDQLVDDPDDEEKGGVIAFDFARPTALCSITLIDIDEANDSELRCYDHSDNMVASVAIQPLGDNSAQTIGFPYELISRLEVDFQGSGGIASLDFLPCPERVDFDYTLTGIPLRLRTGEVMTDQLRPSAGFEISAINNKAGHPDKAILFDSANPTGGDTDLATPGPGTGNLVPRGKMLIIAENDVDADNDGAIDDPDDEGVGGILRIVFDYDVVFRAATVLDVEAGETSWFEAFAANGSSLGSFPLAGLSDNSLQSIAPELGGVRRIELNLGGSGALTDLVYCYDPHPLPIIGRGAQN